MNDVPPEVTVEILAHLDSHTLNHVARHVCSSWRTVINDDFLWHLRAQKYFAVWLPLLAHMARDPRWLCQACDGPLSVDPKTTKFSGSALYHRERTAKRIGITYVGEFSGGFFHGAGALMTTVADFDYYSGHWKHGQQHGHGKYSWKKGESFYVGESRDGKRHGHGEYQWDPERKYVGEHRADQMWGTGVFTHKNGTISGGWRANQQHGHCVVKGGPDGPAWKFEGEYVNGECGDGVYTWLE